MRRFQCGACRLFGHTIRACPNKLRKAQERARRLQLYIDSHSAHCPSWIWKEIAGLLDDIEAVP